MVPMVGDGSLLALVNNDHEIALGSNNPVHPFKRCNNLCVSLSQDGGGSWQQAAQCVDGHRWVLNPKPYTLILTLNPNPKP